MTVKEAIARLNFGILKRVNPSKPFRDIAVGFGELPLVPIANSGNGSVP
jgi:hypothetical protein